jgi:hypothetical protein
VRLAHPCMSVREPNSVHITHSVMVHTAHCVSACVLARCYFSCEPLRCAVGALLLLLLLLQVGCSAAPNLGVIRLRERTELSS